MSPYSAILIQHNDVTNVVSSSRKFGKEIKRQIDITSKSDEMISILIDMYFFTLIMLTVYIHKPNGR